MRISFSLRQCILPVLLAGLLGTAGCSPVVTYRGYIPSTEKIQSLSQGTDTRQSVQKKLGTPSLTGSFDDAVWYYVSYAEERTGFLEPTVTSQQVLAVSFNAQGVVEQTNTYGLEEGRIIDLVTRQTPTHGKDLNVLQQLLSNIGRFNNNGANRGLVGNRAPGT